MSERSKPEPSDAAVIAFAVDSGWDRCGGDWIDPSPGKTNRLSVVAALVTMREEYAKQHPVEWTEKSVLAGHGYNTAGAALGVKSMASEIAAFRNAAREPDDGKWTERAASAIQRYWNGYGSSAMEIAAIIRKHAPGSAT